MDWSFCFLGKLEKMKRIVAMLRTLITDMRLLFAFDAK